MEKALQAYIYKVLDSPEYKEYALQKEKVKQYPELKAQIDAFRIRNFEMQTSKDMVFEMIEAFEREYRDFRENPMVDEFLAAELAFCRLLQKNNAKIMDAIDFE